jgi:hypothetical protein
MCKIRAKLLNRPQELETTVLSPLVTSITHIPAVNLALILSILCHGCVMREFIVN